MFYFLSGMLNSKKYSNKPVILFMLFRVLEFFKIKPDKVLSSILSYSFSRNDRFIKSQNFSVVHRS